MPDDSDRETWRVTTDPDRIEALAAEYDVAPMLVEEPTDAAPGVDRETGGASGERLSWDAFAEEFEAGDYVAVYRENAPPGAEDPIRIVERGPFVERVEGAEKLTEPTEIPADQLALSDTGEGEPVIFDATASEGAADRDVRTAESESSRGAEDEALVLDEIYEDPGDVGPDPEDEYLVFRNTADDPLDVSGWTVSNEAGRTYEFPSGTVLDPGGEVTLHSGQGTDEPGHRYWGADEHVWDVEGDTVTVTTAGGRELIREPYKR